MSFQTFIIYFLSIIIIFPYIFLIFVVCLSGLYTKSLRSNYLSIFGYPFRIIQKITRGGALRYAFYKASTIPSNQLRLLIYKISGAHIQEKVIVHYGLELRSPHYLILGQGTIIGDNAILDARSGLSLGKNVNLSSNVSIYTLQHNHRRPKFDCIFNDRKLSVDIGDRVWLGCNVVILPGVKIGEGAVVCAGAVVTKDIEPYTVVAGIPAKKVGIRPNNLTYEFDGKTCWFL